MKIRILTNMNREQQEIVSSMNDRGYESHLGYDNDEQEHQNVFLLQSEDDAKRFDRDLIEVEEMVIDLLNS